MKPSPVRAIAGVLVALFLEPAAAPAQDQGTAPAQEQDTAAPPQAQPAPTYTQAQLDQILAPIALYPDQLVSQILMAATYPLEVVEAARWVKDSNNARLRGDQLAAALDPVNWDPSVKSLVPFPVILAMMDQRLDWTQNLGDAFLSQQADVMDSVQRLRSEAQAAGTLQSTAQQTVTSTGQAIVIQPAQANVVYVPVYNPTVVYGAWPYPDYPPYYFAPTPAYFVGSVLAAGIGFTIGFAIAHEFWGWNNWDWGHHRIYLDHDRYNAINNYFIVSGHRTRYDRDTWQHDPYHRRGVVYRDAPTRARLYDAPAGPPATRRDFRGYDRSARPAEEANRARFDSHGGSGPANRPAEPRGEGRKGLKGPEAYRPSASVQRAPEAGHRPPSQLPRAVPRAPPPAFQGYEKGPDVHAHAERGRASIQTMRPTQESRPPARLAPSPQRAAPFGGPPTKGVQSGGGGRNGGQPGGGGGKDGHSGGGGGKGGGSSQDEKRHGGRPGR